MAPRRPGPRLQPINVAQLHDLGGLALAQSLFFQAIGNTQRLISGGDEQAAGSGEAADRPMVATPTGHRSDC